MRTQHSKLSGLISFSSNYEADGVGGLWMILSSSDREGSLLRVKPLMFWSI